MTIQADLIIIYC